MSGTLYLAIVEHRGALRITALLGPQAPYIAPHSIPPASYGFYEANNKL